MADQFEKIIFNGKQYFLIDDAIATKEQYENGQTSFAHLCEDGIIRRFNEQIGTREDIKFTGEFVELNPSPEAIFRIISALMSEL